MEEFQELAINIKSLLEKLRKVGSAKRTHDWFVKTELLATQYYSELGKITSQLTELENLSIKEDQSTLLSAFKDIHTILGKVKSAGFISVPEPKINNSQEQKASPSKMNFELKEAGAIIKEFHGEAAKVRDFVDAVTYYSELLNESAQINLLNYVYATCLKGKAKQIFLSKPENLQNLLDQLIVRFKPRETIAEVSRKMQLCTQGPRAVTKYVSELESLCGRLTDLQISKRGQEHAGTVRAICEDTTLSAFKEGLRPEIRIVVVAARPATFGEAIDIALEAEQADNGQEMHSHSFYRGNGRGGRTRRYNYRGTADRGNNNGISPNRSNRESPSGRGGMAHNRGWYRGYRPSRGTDLRGRGRPSRGRGYWGTANSTPRSDRSLNYAEATNREEVQEVLPHFRPANNNISSMANDNELNAYSTFFRR